MKGFSIIELMLAISLSGAIGVTTLKVVSSAKQSSQKIELFANLHNEMNRIHSYYLSKIEKGNNILDVNFCNEAKICLANNSCPNIINDRSLAEATSSTCTVKNEKNTLLSGTETNPRKLKNDARNCTDNANANCIFDVITKFGLNKASNAIEMWVYIKLNNNELNNTSFKNVKELSGYQMKIKMPLTLIINSNLSSNNADTAAKDRYCKTSEAFNGFDASNKPVCVKLNTCPADKLIVKALIDGTTENVCVDTVASATTNNTQACPEGQYPTFDATTNTTTCVNLPTTTASSFKLLCNLSPNGTPLFNPTGFIMESASSCNPKLCGDAYTNFRCGFRYQICGGDWVYVCTLGPTGIKGATGSKGAKGYPAQCDTSNSDDGTCSL